MDLNTGPVVHFSHVSEKTLLQLAGYLTYVQAEKLAIQLGIDQGHISTLRRIYVEDAQMFAYNLLQKWWNSCELEDEEAKDELGQCLRNSQLGGLARTVLGIQDDGTGLTEHYIMTTVECLNHAQVERLAISLGVKSNMLDCLHKMYPDDPQLFGFRIVLHWRDSCDLTPEQQKEQLELAMESLSSVSLDQNYVNLGNGHTINNGRFLIDEVETDFPTLSLRKYRRTRQRDTTFVTTSKTKACCKHSICRWFCGFFLFLLVILPVLVVIAIIMSLPSLKDFTYLVQPGDTVLIPVHQTWITSLTLLVSSDSLCIGKAMAIECSKLQPHYQWKSVTHRSFNYMTTGSSFHFQTIALSEPGFLWIFSDFETYTSATAKKFQGLDCGQPGKGTWCYAFDNKNHSNVTYSITNSGYYFYYCNPYFSCPHIKLFEMYQGAYSFSRLSLSHSYIHLNQQKPAQLVIRNKYDYSSKDMCVLTYISTDSRNSCPTEDRVTINISNQKRRYGLLILPGLLSGLLLICLLIYCFTCVYRLCRLRHHVSEVDYQELTNFPTDI